MGDIALDDLLEIAKVEIKRFGAEIGLEWPITAQETIDGLKDAVRDAEAGRIYMHPDQMLAYLFTVTILEMIEEGKDSETKQLQSAIDVLLDIGCEQDRTLVRELLGKNEERG